MKIGRENDSQAMGRPEQSSKPPVRKSVKGDAPRASRLDVTESPKKPVTDTVQISGAQRTGQEPLATYDVTRAQGPQAIAKARATPLSDEARLERIRHRIDQGFYDRADVKETIARRLADELADDGAGLVE